MTSNPKTFRDLTERLARAVAWIEKSGWPTRAQDVELANCLYYDWITATDRQWRSSGERDRYPLITALDASFRERHDATAAEHMCVLFTTAFEARARTARVQDI